MMVLALPFRETTYHAQPGACEPSKNFISRGRFLFFIMFSMHNFRRWVLSFGVISDCS